MANDLQFNNPTDGAVPVDLQFGVEGGGGGPPTFDLVLAATLPAPIGDFQSELVELAQIVGYVQGPVAAIAGEFDINVDRDPKSERTTSWQVADAGKTAWQGNGWKTPLRNKPVISPPFQEAAPLGISRRGSSKTAPRLRKGKTTQYEEGIPLDSARGFTSQQGARLRASLDGRFEGGAILNWFAGSTYQYAAALRRFQSHVNEQGADLGTAIESNFRPLSDSIAWTKAGRFEQAGLPDKGMWGGPVIVDPEVPPVYEPETLDLRFCLPLNLVQHEYLRFGVDPCEIPPQPPVAIPILRVYVVSNSAQIVRVSDGTDIPASSVSLTTDIGSFAWEMSATVIGKDAAALVEGTDAEPVEVDVTINGYTWRVLVDSWSLREAAVTTTGSISGRSRSAYLTAPYTQPRSFIYTGADRLMSQLADDELFGTGWTVTWNAASWLVPANAWAYQNQTPMGAIARLAEAAGGFVRTDRTANNIIVDPRYPFAPWTWEAQTPAIELPKDVLFQRSSSKTPGTGVNGVFVHGGTNGGVLAHVRRNGTAGDVLGSTVVDDLITHIDGARERGIAALAETTRQSVETFDLPLSASMGGLRTPGELVAIGTGDAPFVKDYTGLIKSVGISANAGRASNGGATLQVRQSLSLERFFAEVV